VAQERYGIYPARFGDLVLRQIHAVEVRTGNSKSEPIPGGALDRGAVITAFAEPMISLRTTDLSGLFGGTPWLGVASGYRVGVADAYTTLGTLIQYQRRVDGSGFSQTNTEHLLLTSSKGFLALEELSADQDSLIGAEASVNYWCLSPDPVTPPLVIARDSGGLTSTPNFSGVWYLGPAYLGTVGSNNQIEGIKRVAIRPNLEYRSKRSDGGPWATHGGIHSRKSEISMTIDKASVAYESFSGMFGNLISANALTFFFQKGAPGGTRVGYSTASHIKVVATTGDATADQFSVTNEDDVSLEVTFRATSSLTLSAAQQIA
jgi:hypothetical protein